MRLTPSFGAGNNCKYPPNPPVCLKGMHRYNLTVLLRCILLLVYYRFLAYTFKEAHLQARLWFHEHRKQKFYDYWPAILFCDRHWRIGDCIFSFPAYDAELLLARSCWITGMHLIMTFRSTTDRIYDGGSIRLLEFSPLCYNCLHIQYSSMLYRFVT